ncbi:MAG: molybdopterin-dependent oxidoreductase, partial [Pseudomonadota bacterium]
KLAQTVGAVRPAEGDDPAWNGLNILHTAAARVGALDVGFVPDDEGMDTTAILEACEAGEIDFVYALGTDELDTTKLKKPFVVYQGSHGDRGASVADVILPAAAYTEQDGLYVNLEGRVQTAHRAHFPPGDAKEDWAIIRALSGVMGAPLPFNSLADLRRILFEAVPHLAIIDAVPEESAFDPATLGRAGPTGDAPFASLIDDFYLTNPIARASETMAECSRLARERLERKGTGTDG